MSTTQYCVLVVASGFGAGNGVAMLELTGFSSFGTAHGAAQVLSQEAGVKAIAFKKD